MKNFKKQVIKIDYLKIENYKTEFLNLINNVNQFKIDLNSKLDTTFSITDVVDFVEKPNTLRGLFQEVQKSKIKKRAELQGVTLSELEKLENIELSKIQLDFIDTAKKLSQSLLFQGMNSKNWLEGGEIILNDAVEKVLKNLCTIYTKNELENSRLAVLKEFRKHLELDKYDKTVMLKILSNNNPESFIGYQSK